MRDEMQGGKMAESASATTQHFITGQLVDVGGDPPTITFVVSCEVARALAKHLYQVLLLDVSSVEDAVRKAEGRGD
jgi:hypothetical protein